MVLIWEKNYQSDGFIYLFIFVGGTKKNCFIYFILIVILFYLQLYNQERVQMLTGYADLNMK